jgi:hypothetical protein
MSQKHVDVDKVAESMREVLVAEQMRGAVEDHVGGREHVKSRNPR